MSHRRPGRREFRTECEDCQDAIVQPLRDKLSEKFQRRCVNPMEILDHEEKRLPIRASLQPLAHRAKGFLPFAHRSQADGGIPLVRRQKQKLCEKRDHVRPAQAKVIEVPREPVESRGRRFIAIKIEKATEVIGNREEAGIAKAKRATPLNDRTILRSVHGFCLGPRHLRAPLFPDDLLDRVHETRLAQTGFPNDQHHLAHPFLSLLPAISEQAYFGITTGQRSERDWRRRLDSTRLDRALLRSHKLFGRVHDSIKD